MEDKYYYNSFDCEIQCEENEDGYDDDDDEDFWEEDPDIKYFV